MFRGCFGRFFGFLSVFQTGGPFLQALLCLLSGIAILLLQLAHQLFALSGELFEVVFGESSELLAEGSGELFPLAFNLIAVHDVECSLAWLLQAEFHAVR